MCMEKLFKNFGQFFSRLFGKQKAVEDDDAKSSEENNTQTESSPENTPQQEQPAKETDATGEAAGEQSADTPTPAPAPADGEPQLTAEELQLKLDKVEGKLKEKEQVLNDLAHDLGVEAAVDEALESLALKQAVDALREKAEKAESANDVYKVVRKHLNEKKKAIVDKCDEASSGVIAANDGTISELLIALLDVAIDSTNDDKAKTQAAPSNEITEAQIRAGVNADILKKYLIEQLNDCGFKFGKNDRKDSVLDELRKLKELSEQPERESDEVIVARAIADANLPADAIKALLNRINGAINNPGMELSGESFDDILKAIAALAAKAQQPSSFEEAEQKAHADDAAVLAKVFGADCAEVSEAGVKELMAKYLCKVLKLEDGELKAVIDELNKRVATAAKAEALKEKLGVNELSKEAVTDKVKEQMLAQLKKACDKESKEVAEAISVEKLVNGLLKVVKDIKKDQSEVIAAVVKYIQEYNCEYAAPQGASIGDLLLEYAERVGNRQKELQENIDAKAKKITDNQSTIAARDKQIDELTEQCSALESDKKALLADSDEMVKFVRKQVKVIEDSAFGLMADCGDDDRSQEHKGILDDRLKRMFTKLKEVSAQATPVETRRAIQDVLKAEIDSKNGAMVTVCRFYAYSLLPFMTDNAREYGVRFNRKNMAALFGAVNDLLVRFGIRVDLPALFAQAESEGDYEVANGKAYSELDNLCPNAQNHLDAIDSTVKPAHIIYDIAQVGYSIDGVAVKKTSILTN